MSATPDTGLYSNRRRAGIIDLNPLIRFTTRYSECKKDGNVLEQISKREIY